MADTLKSLLVKLGLDAKDLEAGMGKVDKSTAGFAGKLAGSLGKIGKAAVVGVAAGVAVAGVAIVAFGVKAVSAAADAGEMMSKLEATFGGASAGMISDLDEFANATGRSRYELRGASADMGAVLKALGFTEEAAADLSSQTVMMSTDLAAFNNLPTADVAARITKAYTGEFESLKALGVVINQSKLEQELLTMGIEGGTKAATDQEKAMAVNAIIMRQTTDAQGAAAAESQSFTGRMVALKAAMSDFTTEVGMKLLPVVTPLLQKFTAMAQDVLPIVVAWIQDNVIPALTTLGEWLGTNLPIAIQAISDFWTNTLLPALTVIWDFIQNKLVPAFQAFVGFISENWQPIVAGLVVVILGVVVPAFIAWAGAAIASAAATIAAIAPIAVPILAIAAVVALLVQAWKKDWGGIRTHLTDFWNNTMKPIGEKIQNIFKGIGEAISKVIGWIGDFIDGLKNIKLPDWLTPGSATPFEIGLWGIEDALSSMANITLPKLQTALKITGPALAPVPAIVGGGMGGAQTVALLKQIASKGGIDEVRLARLIRDAVLQATG